MNDDLKLNVKMCELCICLSLCSCRLNLLMSLNYILMVDHLRVKTALKI